MLSIVYVSSESRPLTEFDLDALLSTSRLNNQRLGVTGVLLYRHGQFLQLIEGPDDGVLKIYGAIEQDTRHQQVRKICEESIVAREFPNWSMSYPPVIDGFAPHRPGLDQYLSYLRRNLQDIEAHASMARMVLRTCTPAQTP